jgi:hypothetical protein
MRSLPRTNASPGFTSEVMRKARAERGQAAHTGDRRGPFIWRMAAALAMVFSLAVVVQITMMQQAQRRKYEDLRAEKQQIQADLQAVKKIAEDAEPVVVLENDRGTRVIVDMDSAIQPASHKTFD